jgi:hypothetical protein
MQQPTSKSRAWFSTAATWGMWFLAAYLLVAATAGILAA